MAFSDEDVEKVLAINHVDQVELVAEGISSYTDYQNNSYESKLALDDAPDFLRNDLAQLNNGDVIQFQFLAQQAPYSVIQHYNENGIDLLYGDFPQNESYEIVIPDLFAYQLTENPEIEQLIDSSIELEVIDEANARQQKDYKIVGIYDSGYQFNLELDYPIYVGYYPQGSPVDEISEEDYNFFYSNYSVNAATEEYSKELIKDIDHLEEEKGTGLGQMIVVVDNEENLEAVRNQIQDIYPKYQLVSQYDLKNGDLSDVYNTLLRTLIIGSITIALIIGIVIVFLNKGYIADRTREFATLISQGYSKGDIMKIITLENIMVYTIYFALAYLLAYGVNRFFLSSTRFGYLFVELLNLENIIILFGLVSIVVLLSILWGMSGLKSRNLIKLLKD